ncbi:hypothetical protein FGE12_23720 [Aggregicoccus sp. 17bor-14]|uniref:hypothetical protein n=1 Tax=Myxococcaceae TaxID=31 RepID=UPI00129C5F8D|nr:MULTISPECIES: hypothetical protein [Myxococcaceae]MBF5045435.1 hypothetical protein [Simulacricoccus sp. 17bor-14]MRI91176.1 hypothetical protein [Aggregicoccus sp. 17bor-14]
MRRLIFLLPLCACAAAPVRFTPEACLDPEPSAQEKAVYAVALPLLYRGVPLHLEPRVLPLTHRLSVSTEDAPPPPPAPHTQRAACLASLPAMPALAPASSSAAPVRLSLSRVQFSEDQRRAELTVSLSCADATALAFPQPLVLELREGRWVDAYGLAPRIEPEPCR